MAVLKFTGTIEIYNGNPYINITAEQVSKLKSGWKKPLPVLVQINGQPKPAWKINMMPKGDGSFYLYLHGDVRKASNTKVGDEVEVNVAFDEKYHSGPMHPMPSWFQSALDENPIAKENWNKLIPSRQKEIVRYLSWLKSVEAKKRNVAKAIHVLSGNTDRFMARTWEKGK